MPMTSDEMNEDIKSYIDQRDTVVEQRIKLWILSSLIAQVFALAPIIFFLGGIYQNANTSIEILKNQQVVLASRGQWMLSVDQQQLEIRAWAKTKGFIPFTPEPKPNP